MYHLTTKHNSSDRLINDSIMPIADHTTWQPDTNDWTEMEDNMVRHIYARKQMINCATAHCMSDYYDQISNHKSNEAN